MLTPTVEQTYEWCELINSTQNCNRHILLHKLCLHFQMYKFSSLRIFVFLKKKGAAGSGAASIGHSWCDQ